MYFPSLVVSLTCFVPAVSVFAPLVFLPLFPKPHPGVYFIWFCISSVFVSFAARLRVFRGFGFALVACLSSHIPACLGVLRLCFYFDNHHTNWNSNSCSVAVNGSQAAEFAAVAPSVIPTGDDRRGES